MQVFISKYKFRHVYLLYLYLLSSMSSKFIVTNKLIRKVQYC